MDQKEKQDDNNEYESDPLLLMEDILDKLKLLDYETLFLKIKYIFHIKEHFNGRQFLQSTVKC